MPDPFRTILRRDDPLAIVYRLIRLEQSVDILVDRRLAETVRPTSPIPDRRNVFECVPGKLRPSFAHLQNAIVFIMDDLWDWGVYNRPIKELAEFILEWS